MINYICFINTFKNTCKTTIGDFLPPCNYFECNPKFGRQRVPPSPSTVTPVTPRISITDCYLFIGWLKVNQKKKINPFMFCGSVGQHCCREWKHLFFLTPHSPQTCFTPLESENWRHGSVKNWTTVPLSPWGTSRMLARQGLPVKSMFCRWRLCGGYINATCYCTSAQSCAYFIP